MEKIKSIKAVLTDYDNFIIDQWGVMHDGTFGYEHAFDAINFLKNSNKNLFIISNSSKRSKSSIDKLPKLGFDKSSFINTVTSGEMIWQELKNFSYKYDFKTKNCFHIFDSSKEDGKDFRIGLEKFKFIDNIKDADFILACTPFQNTKPIDYIPILKEALEMNLIMFCANPDFVTVEENNEKNIYCMGTIADLYDHMGGKVVILGKPSKEIYLKSCKQLDQINKSKTIAVGDSLDHDILGASNFGVDSVLITSGIHKDLFKYSLEKGIKNIENDRKWNFKPTYVCENFSF